MKIALLGTVRTRERTSDVSEESRRRKFFGERTAVHSHKRLSCPLALVVQQVGDMLLARAVLPEYQHAHVGGGYQPYPLHDGLERRAVTREQGHTAPSDIPFFQYGTEQRDELVFHKLLGYVVQRAEFHAFHCRMHFGIVGHDDKGLHPTLLAHPAQKVDTVAVGQAQVGNHDVPVCGLLQIFLRGREVESLHGAESLACQQVADELAIHDVVLHHDDFCLIHFRIFSFLLLPAGLSPNPYPAQLLLHCQLFYRQACHRNEAVYKAPLTVGRHGVSPTNFAGGV